MGMKVYDDLLEKKHYCWLSFKTLSSNVQNRAPQVPSQGKFF